jgi:hypothetical protein
VSAALQIAERANALAQQQNEAALMMGAYRALASTLHYLGDFESSQRYAICGLQIWRSGTVQSSIEEYYTPAVACLVYLAFSEWHLG